MYLWNVVTGRVYRSNYFNVVKDVRDLPQSDLSTAEKNLICSLIWDIPNDLSSLYLKHPKAYGKLTRDTAYKFIKCFILHQFITIKEIICLEKNDINEQLIVRYLEQMDLFDAKWASELAQALSEAGNLEDKKKVLDLQLSEKLNEVDKSVDPLFWMVPALPFITEITNSTLHNLTTYRGESLLN